MRKDLDNQVVDLQHQPTLESLPVEILLKIISYLDIAELAIVGCLNHSFKKISDTPSLWRNRFQHRLQINPDNIPDYVFSSMKLKKEFYLKQSIRLVNTGTGSVAYWLRNIIRKKSTEIRVDDSALRDFTFRQWQALGEIISGFTMVKSIYLSGGYMSDFSTSQKLATYRLFINSKLIKIALPYINFRVREFAQWQIFCEALKNAKSVRKLQLHNNHLGELQTIHWRCFGEFLKVSQITKLGLANNNLFKLSNANWRAFLAAISNASMLVSLNLNSNEYMGRAYPNRQTSFYKKIANLLTQSYYLTTELKIQILLEELSVARNKLGDDGIYYLAPYLTEKDTLRVIDVSDNFITVEGVNSLVKALKNNTSLKSINISSNKIANTGASAIANLLLFNSKIEKINLSKNEIGDEGAYALFSSLITNFNIKSLGLWDNKINRTIVYNIKYLLNRNKVINLYPLHVDLILAAYAKKRLYQVTYIPLALRTLCGLAILNKIKKSRDEKHIKQQDNEVVSLLLSELSSISNWVRKDLYDNSLPLYGCNVFFTPTKTKSFSIENRIQSLSTIWRKGAVEYMLQYQPENVKNDLEKRIYQIFQTAKEFLFQEAFEPILSDSIYCIKLQSQNEGLVKLKELNDKFKFTDEKSPQVSFFMNKFKTKKHFSLFYLRGNLIRISLATLCRYIVKKDLRANILLGNIKYDLQKIDSYLHDKKNPEAQLIQMIDKKIQSFHSQQLTNIRISNFNLTSSNKIVFMQKLCGSGMKMHQFNDDVLYYTSPSMSQNHMKIFIRAVEDAFAAIRFNFEKSSKLQVPCTKYKNQTIVYTVNSQVNPNYVRAYISEWLVDQLVAKQQELSVFAIYPPPKDDSDDDSVYEYSL